MNTQIVILYTQELQQLNVNTIYYIPVSVLVLTVTINIPNIVNICFTQLDKSSVTCVTIWMNKSIYLLVFTYYFIIITILRLNNQLLCTLFQYIVYKLYFGILLPVHISWVNY